MNLKSSESHSSRVKLASIYNSFHFKDIQLQFYECYFRTHGQLLAALSIKTQRQRANSACCHFTDICDTCVAMETRLTVAH
jgi:hypothetical protein